MASISGQFDLRSGTGYARGHVYAPSFEWAVDVTFTIDTGSSCTVLVDEDFVNALQAMGVLIRRDPTLLGAVSAFTSLLAKQTGGLCLAGRTNPLYRIEDSRVYLCDPDGKLKHDGQDYGPVYGVFSAGYLNPATAMNDSHPSLLGRDVLNRMKRLVWRRPRNKLALTIR